MTTAEATAATLTAPDPAKESPYVGLRPYVETDAKRYFGREDIVAELARMVRRASLTTLFGVSGTGKSSLIGAGLFPLLRNELHLPVLIRLDFTTEDRDLRAQVRKAIIRQLDEHNVDAPRPTEGMPLRRYFARNPWWNPRNKPLTPFIVFDQFEEIFTVGREHAEEVAALMDELADLVERPYGDPADLVEPAKPESGAPSAAGVDAPLDVVAPRPRLMFALREDFLAHLEDFRGSIPSLAANRYRLTRMNGAQALNAVLKPAAGIVDDATARKIVRFVASGADSIETVAIPEEEAERKHPLDSLEVEPAILSLVCEQLDLQRREQQLPQITTDLLTTQGERIVESFYEAAFADLPKAVRVLVEDRLVTSSGFRTTMEKASAFDIPGVTHDGIKALLDKKILREEVRFNALHIELIHDRLAVIARESRAHRREEEREQDARARDEQREREATEREERRQREAKAREEQLQRQAEEREQERQRKWRRKIAVASGVTGLLLIVAAVAFILITGAQKAKAEREHTRDVSMQLSTFLLRASRDALARADALTAVDRVKEASDALARVGQMPPPEAQLYLDRGVISLAGRVQTVDHGSEIDAVRITGSRRLLTVGRDGSVRAWRGRQPETVLPGDASGPPIEETHPANAGKWVLVVRKDGSGEVRDLDGGATRLSFESPHSNQMVQQTARPSTVTEPASAGAMATAGSERISPVVVTKPKWQACVAPDDSTLAVWNSTETGVRAWHPEPVQHINSRWLDTVRPQYVACLGNGALAVVTQRNDIVLLDGSGVARKTFSPSKEYETWGFAAADDGSMFALVLEDGVLLLDDPKQEPRRISPPAAEIVELSPGGDLALTAGEGSGGVTFIGVWNTRDGSLQFAVERSAPEAHLVRSDDGLVLVVLSHHLAEAWKVGTWESLGTASFEDDLAAANTDVRVDGSVFVAAATKNTAAVRGLGEPWWADWSTLKGNEQLGRWRIPSYDENADQRSADIHRVDIDNAKLVLRTPAGAIKTVVAERPLSDARITTAPDGSIRVAALRGDGVVTLYDGRLEVTARLDTFPVRAIRWSARGELITIGWSQTQVWGPDGKLLSTFAVAADDASMVYTPRSLLWTCTRSECSAWDLATHDRLSRVKIDGARAVELSQRDPVAVAKISSSDGVLLPVAARQGDTIGPAGAVRALSRIGSELAVTFDDGETYVVGPKRHVASGPFESLRDGAAAGAGPTLLMRSGAATGKLVFSPVWQSDSALVAIRAHANLVGVIDATLRLALLSGPFPGANKPSVQVTPDDTLEPSGTRAAFSRGGDRRALVTPRNTIAVRLVDGDRLEGTYDVPADQRVRMVFPSNRGRSHVVALTDLGLVVWGAPGKPSDLRRGSYREASMDGEGEYLIALRGDDHVEVFMLQNGKLSLVKELAAISVAMDNAATRIAVATGKGKIDIYQVPDLDTARFHHDVKKTFSGPIVLSPNAKYMWLPAEQKLVRVSTREDIKLEDATHCAFGGGSEYAVCVFTDWAGPTLQAVEAATGTRIGPRSLLPRSPERLVRCSSADFHVALALVNGDATPTYTFDPKQKTFSRVLSRNVESCTYSYPQLWTQSDGGLLEAWNPLTHGVVESRGGASLLDAIATSDGLHAAIGIPGHNVKIKSLTTARTETRDLDNSAGVERAVFVNERQIAYVQQDQVKIASFRVDHDPPRLLDATKLPVTALVVLENPGGLVVGHDGGSVDVFKNTDTRPYATLPGLGSPARRFAIDDAGRWLAVAYDDGTVAIWPIAHDPKQGERAPLVRLDVGGRTRAAPALLFDHGDPVKTLYTGSADGEVRRWNLGATIPYADEIVDAAREQPKASAR